MNILVLSPHTDDCELGCGGSLTKWMREGHNIISIVFSLCEKSIPRQFKKDITKEEFITNARFYSNHYKIFNYPVREFPKYRQEILEDMIKLREYKPDLILCPSLNDIHQDHKTIAEEARRAFRCSILSYELFYTSLNFNPQHYIILSEEDLEDKTRMCQEYKSQIFKGKGYTEKEFIYGWAKTRGGQVDKDYAEAFECIRYVS